MDRTLTDRTSRKRCFFFLCPTVDSGSALAVFVDSDGNLGVTVSSLRFKEDIQPMDDASAAIMNLHPVSFRYQRDVEGAPRSYGLIAEEVAVAAPDLVVRDAEGQPFSVRYHLLAPMLLNELQKEARRSREQQRTIETLIARLEAVESQLEQYTEPAEAKP